jgi:hypothetical protein
MAEAQMKVPCTIMGAIVFGSTCRHSSFGVEVPSVTAAST